MKIPTTGSFYDLRTSTNNNEVPESFNSFARFLGLSVLSVNEYLNEGESVLSVNRYLNEGESVLSVNRYLNGGESVLSVNKYLHDDESKDYHQSQERNSVFQEASTLNRSPFGTNGLRDTRAAYEGNLVRGAEAAPQEDIIRGAEAAASQEGTSTPPEAAASQEGTHRRPEVAAPQGGTIRRPEVTQANSKRHVMLGSEVEGNKETLKLKSKIKTLDATFQSFFKKMAKSSRIQSDPNLKAVFDSIIQNKEDVMKLIANNLRASLAITDLALYDKLIAKDENAVNKLRHKQFKFEVQVSKSEENENEKFKVFLKTKDNSLIELYPVSSSNFIKHRTKHSSYDNAIKTLISRSAETMKSAIGMM